MPSAVLPQDLVSFLLDHHSQDIEQLLASTDSADEQSGVHTSLLQLASWDAAIAEALLAAPCQVMPVLHMALDIAQEQILAQLSQTQSDSTLSCKPLAQVRLKGLPGGTTFARDVPEHGPTIHQLRCRNTRRLVRMSGTVTRTGAVCMVEAQRALQCTKCKFRWLVSADQEDGFLPPLEGCPSVSSTGKPCEGTSLRWDEAMLHTNLQEVRVQELAQCLNMGALPRSMVVLLQDELVDRCKAGDVVEITGIIHRRWHQAKPGLRCSVELVVVAADLQVCSPHAGVPHHEQATEEQFLSFWQQHTGYELRGRDQIVAAMCPQIHGLALVKLATLLMLVGGEQRHDDGGARIRGEIHMLLVGDPGMAKSQFLRFCAKLSPRSVLTSGRGSTTAGLTVAAVKNNGQWGLEAGALVLADGGLCCIDEFDGVPEGERAALHEALEQQTISIAKAGLVTTLSTRTSIFGTMNPHVKPQHRATAAATELTGLSGPLLSRFDILVLLEDSRMPAWDSLICDHILSSHHPDALSKQEDHSTTETLWTAERLAQYILWAKTFHPVLSPEAEKILVSYYQLQRQAALGCRARTTIRMLEGLVRIAQAHAKLMARNIVTQQDAVVAVLVAASSVSNSSAELHGLIPLQAGFAEDPDHEYSVLSGRVMAALQRCEDGQLCHSGF